MGEQRGEGEGLDCGKARDAGLEWLSWGGSSAVCAIFIVGVSVWTGRADGIPAGLMALAFCSSVAVIPIFWRRGSVGSPMPVVFPLMTIAIRMLLMFGALGLVTAIKWSHRNSFSWSLLGCYFIFLALESALSICYYSSRVSR
jgi:hypothetical protein